MGLGSGSPRGREPGRVPGLRPAHSRRRRSDPSATSVLDTPEGRSMLALGSAGRLPRRPPGRVRRGVRLATGRRSGSARSTRLASRELPGTEDAGLPFWSPDGRVGRVLHGRRAAPGQPGGRCRPEDLRAPGGLHGRGRLERDGTILFSAGGWRRATLHGVRRAGARPHRSRPTTPRGERPPTSGPGSSPMDATSCSRSSACAPSAAACTWPPSTRPSERRRLLPRLTAPSTRPATSSSPATATCSPSRSTRGAGSSTGRAAGDRAPRWRRCASRAPDWGWFSASLGRPPGVPSEGEIAGTRSSSGSIARGARLGVVRRAGEPIVSSHSRPTRDRSRWSSWLPGRDGGHLDDRRRARRRHPTDLRQGAGTTIPSGRRTGASSSSPRTGRPDSSCTERRSRAIEPEKRRREGAGDRLARELDAGREGADRPPRPEDDPRPAVARGGPARDDPPEGLRDGRAPGLPRRALARLRRGGVRPLVDVYVEPLPAPRRAGARLAGRRRAAEVARRRQGALLRHARRPSDGGRGEGDGRSARGDASRSPLLGRDQRTPSGTGTR